MKRIFGHHPDGTPTHSFTLESQAGLRAEILDYGGILRSLSFPGRQGRTPLVLGFDTIDAYLGDSAYLGVIAGRYANRIAGARFSLDGRRWELAANEPPNHLHGGLLGLGKRVWRVLEWEDAPQPRLRIGYRSPAGEEGYPGNLDVTATFTLIDAELRVDFEATTDAATPVNLTYHPYFNLSGDPAAALSEQWLTVAADRFLPISPSFIPTGEIARVDGTPFDFRNGRTLALSTHESDDPQLKNGGGYDHCLVLAQGAPFTAELYSELSGIHMQILSDMPAVQLYGGHWLAGAHPGLGRGLCLEPQEFPNAPNEPRFPDTTLRPGQLLRRTIRYRFTNRATR